MAQIGSAKRIVFYSTIEKKKRKKKDEGRKKYERIIADIVIRR